MAPKRPLPNLTSPVKKRKTQSKGASDGNIESFFTRSLNASDPARNLTDVVEPTRKSRLDEAEDDEALALRLAAEEGLELETALQLEKEWKANATRNLKRTVSEVIDVDAVDEPDEIRQGSSLPATENGRMPGNLKSLSQLPRVNQFTSSATFRGSDSHVDMSAYPNLAVDPLVFSTFDCPWTSNSSAPYSFLAHTLCMLSKTRSRISISDILTNALRSLIQHDSTALLPALYLLSNSLAPPYIPLELGLGPSIISKAIQSVSGIKQQALRQLYSKLGDVGDVAFEAKSTIQTLIPPLPLTIAGVYETLLKICRSKGEGVAKIKQSLVEKLLVATRGEETRFLARTLAQHIRVGAVRTSMLTALARAMVLTRPPSLSEFPDGSSYFIPPHTLSSILSLQNVTMSRKGKNKESDDPIRTMASAKYAKAETLVKSVYVKHPNYDHIVRALLDYGIEKLNDTVSLSIGIPLLPTLGSPTRSLDEIYQRLGNLPFAAEFKYDGQRAQIHAMKSVNNDVSVKLFSRHLEDMTEKYPDVISLIRMIFDADCTVTQFIMDAEIVAIDPKDGSIKTFQELSNRARKDVRLEDVKINVCIFAFDLMYYNGRILLEQPFRNRRQLLKTHFPPLTPDSSMIARFAHVESCESEDGREAVEEFWQKAVDSRSEGLMIKLLDSGEIPENEDNEKITTRKKPLPATYEPDKRTSAWLKLKKDYVLGLGDSLDLVPIGAWHGNGRKAAWWSPILLAVWNETSNQFVAVCKCMSGFTDEFYKALNERFVDHSETCMRKSQWNVNTGGYEPEVYFKPQEVWEIRGADITISPVSTAALGFISQERGLSLRFPRFIRIREDKGVMDASTPEFLAAMWRTQENRDNLRKLDTGGVDEGDLVDALSSTSEIEDEYDL